MPTVRFEGRVIPEAAKLTIDSHPSVTLKDEYSDFWMEFTAVIKDGVVIIECDVEEYEQAKHFDSIFVRATDIARASVNLVAFTMGLGVFVVLDTFTDPDGAKTVLLLRDRPLGSLSAPFIADATDFNRRLDLVLMEPRIWMALRDLVWSLSSTHEIPASCARAVETLRSLIVPKGVDRREGWPLLRANLRVSEDYLRLITDHAKGPRHGDHLYVPGTMTREIATRSWVLMNRFLEYRKRGSKPLPESEFPLLTG
jgi:hypothetical protein